MESEEIVFDKKYYKEVRRLIHNNIYKFGWSPTVYIDMMPELEEKEDYEALQAIRDELEEFLKVYKNK